MALVTETFKGAVADLVNHTSDSGHAWLKGDTTTGIFLITAEGMVRLSGNVQAINYLDVTPSSTNYDLNFVLSVKSNDTNYNLDLYASYAGTVRTLMACRLNCFAGRWELWKVVTGSGSQVGTPSTQTITAGTTISGTFRRRGNVYTLLIGGVSKITYTDSTSPITAVGKPGIGAFVNSGSGITDSTGIHIDSLEVVEGASFSVSPGTITQGTTGNTVTLTGTNTAWTPGTPGSPSFGLTGGTGASKTAQSVASTTSATLTVDAGSATGTLTITDPDSGATNTLTVAAVPPVTIGVSNSTFQAGLSPYNWYTNGTTDIRTSHVGAYGKWLVSLPASSYVKLLVDVSHLSGVSSGSYPTIAYSLDDGAWTTRQLTSGDGGGITLGSSLSSGNHSVRVIFYRSDYTLDHWTSPKGLRITGLELSTGSSIVTHSGSVALRSKRAAVFGDSLADAIFISASNASGGDALACFVNALGNGMDAEIGAIGHGSQGWTRDSAQNNAPRFYNSTTPSSSAWDKHYSGVSRLSGGLLSLAPDYLFVMHGTNDGLNSALDADVTLAVNGWITAARASAPSAKIFVVIPPGRYKASAIQAGVTSAGDANTYLLDLGTGISSGLSGPQGTASRRSVDSIHPNAAAHAEIAGLIAAKAQYVLGQAAGAASGGSGNIFGGGVIR